MDLIEIEIEQASKFGDPTKQTKKKDAPDDSNKDPDEGFNPV